MLLIRTDQFASFEEYLASLSRKAKKEHARIIKLYGRADYYEWYAWDDHHNFPIDEVRHFMSLWEQQLIRGKHVQWAFPVEYISDLFQRGELKLFSLNLDGEQVALHFIQKRDGYWECHPPMYDKTRFPSLAKIMWFMLIHYAISNRLGVLDLGGGPDDWREHIRNRAEYPNPRYKWLYVPERAKRDPESEPAFIIERPLCRLRLKD